MSRARVFFVVGSLEANDTGDELVSILSRLSRASFEPRVVSLGRADELRGRIVGMKVRVYPLGLSGALGEVLAVPRLGKLLRSMDAEVVHAFGSWAGSVAALAAPRGVPVLRSVSDPPASRGGLEGWLLSFLERRAAQREGVHYLVPDEASRGLVVQRYGGGETSVLPASLDLADVRERVGALGRDGGRRHLGIVDGETVFGCISPFHSETTMDEVLRGVSVARRERPGTRVFLVGAGRYEASGRWKAEELQLDDAVVFLGRGRDADALWAAADVVVDAAPSPGWSRDALLAHAAGLPVVKRAEGVVSGELDEEAPIPRISGRADWFASDLLRLAEDGELRRRLAARAPEHLAGHDAGEVAETLRALYGGLT